MRFQYILLTVFAVITVVAVIVFAKSDPKNQNNGPGSIPPGTYTIWGVYPQDGMNAALQKFNEVHQKEFTVSYEYRDPKRFDQEIVEALASHKGPDLLLLPNDLIVRHSDKIEEFSYQSIGGMNVFENGYVQAAEAYEGETGVSAIPFAIDPLVMYWNRDLFANASLTLPPSNWEEFLAIAPKLTLRNKKTGEITQSATPFGEYANVVRGKEILSALFLQVGSTIVSRKNGVTFASLGEINGAQFVPNQDVVSALRFFMGFSDPLKDIYTWNRSRSNALNEFINGNLAVYFDYASAYNLIRNKNPHLNFAVAELPIPQNTKVRTTYAAVHGLTVLKDSPQKNGAFKVAVALLSDENVIKTFDEYFYLPPVTRALLSVKPTDAALSVFYDAAIRARTWLDPKPRETDEAFRFAVENVSSGRMTAENSINDLQARLTAIIAGQYNDVYDK